MLAAHVAQMRVREPAPAHGAFMALQTTLAVTAGLSTMSSRSAAGKWNSPRRSAVMGRMTRAYQLTLAGFTDEADAIVAEAGRIDDWDLPASILSIPALARADNAPPRSTESRTCN